MQRLPLYSSVALATAVAIGAFAVGCSSCKNDSNTSPEAPSSSALAPPVDAGPPSIPSAQLQAVINPDKLPVYDGATGSLEGTVYVIGDPAPKVDKDFSKCPAGEKVYGKMFREGVPGEGGKRTLGDAVVGVTGYKGFVAEKQPGKRIEFDDCAFPTRTVTMTFGQFLEIANKSRLSIAPAFEQGGTSVLRVAPPGERGDPVKLVPPQAGYFTLVDRVTARYLEVDVYALAFPLHTVTTLDGKYRIDGIPVGKVTLGAHLPKIDQKTYDVEILANVVKQVDLVLEYHATPTVDAGALSDAASPPRDAGKPRDAGAVDMLH